MLNLHTHLLPCVDDGCKTADEALALLDELECIGFDSTVLTPHFYPTRETSGNFIARRDRAVESFKKHCADKNISVACECYLHEYLFNAQDITDLCITLGNKKYLLTELSYGIFDGKHMLKLCKRLISAYKITPVLAHIERYPYIMYNEDFFKEFLDIGCLSQVNMKSFAVPFVRKRLAYYVNNGYIRFIGTDTHRQPIDARIYQRAADYLEKKLGKEWRTKF
ncbi:MAG: hypothetical protein E7588_05325 [Ruminococcaceae bacterium]|nr:hypothetical protein [Oscillospiraceae bacterium]